MTEKQRKKQEEVLRMHNSVAGTTPGNNDSVVQSTPSSSSGSKVQQRKAQFLQMHNQYKDIFSVTNSGREEDSKVSSFFIDAQNYLRESSNASLKSTWSSIMGEGKQENRKTVASNWEERAGWVRSYLMDNRDDIDEKRYQNLIKQLDNIETGFKSINKANSQAEEYFSQWQTEDDYKKWKKDIEDYEALTSFDVVNGSKEIEHLESVLKEYRFLVRNMSGDNPSSRLRHIVNVYGSEEKLKELISKKQQYLTQAQRLQDSLRMKGVADRKSKYYDPEYAYWSSKRGPLPTYQQIENYDTMMDRSTWQMMDDGKLYDALGNVIDYTKRDASGKVVHPYADSVDTTDKLGIYLAAKADSVAYSATENAWGTLDRILAEGDSRHWDKLTEDQINTYYYYLNKEGTESAEKYLDLVQYDVNEIVGTEKYSNIGDSNLSKVLFGVEAGLDQWGAGLAGLGRELRGEEGYVNPTATQFAAAKVGEDLNESGELWRTAYDAVTTMSNMAPSFLTGVVANALIPGSGVVGTALMGASASGSAYDEMINEGYSVKQARTYGTLIGASEVALESLLGGISEIGGGALGKPILKALAGADSALYKLVVNMGNTAAGRILGSMIDEGNEEGLQEILGTWLKNIITHSDEDVDWNEVAYSALLGAITGGVFEGASVAGNAAIKSAETRDIGSTIVNTPGGVDALKSLAEEEGVDSSKVSAETNSGEGLGGKISAAVKNAKNEKATGKLYRSMEASVATQTQETIAKSLEESGYSKASALEISSALSAYLDGKELSRYQQNVINEVKDSNAVQDAIKAAVGSDAAKRSFRFNRDIAAAANIPSVKENAEVDTTDPSLEGRSKKYGDQAKAMISTYNIGGGNQDIAQFDQAYQLAYNMGKAGVSLDYVKNSSSVNYLSPSQRELAYEAGLAAHSTVAEASITDTISGLNLNADTASTLLGSFETMKMTDTQVQEASVGLRKAYEFGTVGNHAELETNHFTAQLTQAQREAVYAAGLKVRKEKVAARESENRTRGVGKQIYHKEFTETVNGVHYDNVRLKGKKLNSYQKTGIQLAEFLAAIGMDVHIYESKVVNGKRIGENGTYYSNDGSIHVDIAAGNMGEGLMAYTISHEFTHFIEDWSPVKFAVFAEALFEELGKTDADVDSMVNRTLARVRTMEEYKGKTESELRDIAYSEVVAECCETMLSDTDVAIKIAERIRKTDNELLNKIIEFFNNLLTKLEKLLKVNVAYKDASPDSVIANEARNTLQHVERLRDLFADAAADAAATFRNAEQKNSTQEGGVVYSLREFVKDGRRFVEIDQEQDRFDGVSVDEYPRIAKGIINERFNGKIVGIDNKMFVNGASRDEFANPSKRITNDLYEVKMRTAGEIDNLLDAGIAMPNEPDGRDGHIHPDAIDFSYYKTLFKIGNRYFDAVVNIKNIKRGKLFKDVTKIEDVTQDIMSSYGQSPASQFLRTSSMNNISNPKDVVNSEAEKVLADTDVEIDTKTKSAAPRVLKSERTWTESDYVKERDQAAQEIAKATGVSVKKAKNYIDDVNSIAKMIADDRVRLDYFSSPGRSSFIGNVEYGGSFDFSTLCKKRRLLTGTFTAIQKALPNTALTANEILDIRNRMKEAGLEVSCGLCYVEGSRANMGQFAKEFLRLYKQYYPDSWQPNMADVNTPEGIEWVRINHPECYGQYEYFWNHYGTLKDGDKNLFASQQKPKLYQLHTEYKGEILQKFRDDDNVEENNLNGGIRLQSFSDFEIVHLIDTMQIIMDMARVGLAGHAYTKVPDFAWALGDTGLKINLSLIAKGVDENGKLIFDDVEGMPIDEAMKLRERYSKNVGTILVAFNDEQLLAAMADGRIDFIIPFHRSQWKKSQYAAMGLPAKTKDYTYMQNEKYIKPQYHEYRGRMVRDKATNYMPNEYWDFSKTGKENAEAYLEMCARNNKRPKFYKLLQNNGDGSYSLKADGSTDGYWKLLIDFKMYDNDGVGSPQLPVRPEFNMTEAQRMLDDYNGGHSNFPAAQGIVDEFVQEYKRNHPDTLYATRGTDSVSNRTLLANALESVAQHEVEVQKLQEYKAKISDVEAKETRLQEIYGMLYPGSADMPAQQKRELQQEATKIRNAITIIDKQLFRLEATKPLQNVLNRERNRVRKEMRDQAKQAAADTKEAEKQRYERRKESHAKTEKKKQIRKTIRDLRKILNHGDKKRNVKEDMKDMVSKTIDSAEVLFTQTYTDEDIVRYGFEVQLNADEEKYFREAQQIIQYMDKIGPGNEAALEKLKNRLDYRMGKLRDALYRERNRMNEATVSQVLGDLADAYASLESSEYNYVSGAYHAEVYEYLKQLQSDMGGAKVRDMSMTQLEELHKAYKMVLETVRNANKMFNENLKQTRDELGNAVMREVQKAGGEHGGWSKLGIQANKFSWNNLKPIYATERIGSETFSKIMGGLFEGQYKWAANMEKARDFRRAIAEKYKANSWDLEKTHTFTSTNGHELTLNVGHILSLYAYSKRDAAHDHLTGGGIVFANGTEVIENHLGVKVHTILESATTYTIGEELLAEIISKLDENQKKYVDEMQTYLSATMGGLGNEVSMRLYGVKLYGEEKYYFPLRVSAEHKEQAAETELKEERGLPSLKNSGFTHSLKPQAKDPIVLDDFNTVWAEHVNDMTMYNGMVLPLEDFRKVFYFRTPHDGGTQSVKGAIINAYGRDARAYFNQLYQELNSGAISDPREAGMMKWVGKFKKAAVMASMSVVVQQPSAIGRAFSEIHPKFFVGEKIGEKRQKQLWEEVKKYAPVAIIKEMGGFDTHTGAGAKDYLLAKEYSKGEIAKALRQDKDYRKETYDMVLGYMPAKADEITWVAIWQAAKREVKAQNQSISGEELLRKAGERFSQVIERTQVYDSVLARSANMRAKTGLMAMTTAFMAEPTTTINMLETAIRGKKNVKRVLASVATSIVLNNLLASVIYAMRDDEEDETFLEKYAQAFTSGMADDLNPITYYPFLKDAWSVMQGYSVERSDMSIVSDLATSLTNAQKIFDKDTSGMDADALAAYSKERRDAILTVADSAFSMLGFPLKNIRRDIESVVNTRDTVTSGLENEKTSLWNHIVDAYIGTIPFVRNKWNRSKSDLLYQAIVDGNGAYEARLKSEYETEDQITAAIRKGLKDNDARIYEAALRQIDGQPRERVRLQKEVIAEGFLQDDVVTATNSIINKLTPDEPTTEPKKKGFYSTEDFTLFVVNGQSNYAKEAKADIIATYEKNGKTADEATASFKSSAKSDLKEAFLAGNLTAAAAEHALKAYCGEEADDAKTTVNKWRSINDTGIAYDDIKAEFMSGNITAAKAIDMRVSYGGYSREDAEAVVAEWQYERDYPELSKQYTYNEYKQWESYGKPNGVSFELYADVYDFRDNGPAERATSQDEVWAYIDSLNISDTQKDAIHLCFWKESTLHKAPWNN